MKNTWFTVVVLILCFACKDKQQHTSKEAMITTTDKGIEANASNINSNQFDTIIDGKPVQLYWLENAQLKMAITNYGGRIVGLYVPDKTGTLIDINIGRGSIKEYLESDEAYFGATIGRVGNRIAKGKFTLNDTVYTIPANNNDNALHGGYKGFQDVVWQAEQLNDQSIGLSYVSPDMEEGFPGNLTVNVTYTLTDDNALKIEYDAVTDESTVVNLTNHAYFNLNGEGSGTILNHSIQIFADAFTPVDSGLIPTGALRPVRGTPFDFTVPHTIGERIAMDNEQLGFGGGYDHNYVLNGQQERGMTHAAKVVGDSSGIKMDVYTKEPGIQFYCGNFMASKNVLKSGARDDVRTAFCLETQHFPDAPNQPNFPSIRLDPGETYSTTSEYRFSIE